MILYVRLSDCVTRRRVIEQLEQDGFTPDRVSRKEILGSRLPLTVDTIQKTYGAMGNVTCAAAAATQGRLIEVDEFYARYKGAE